LTETFVGNDFDCDAFNDYCIYTAKAQKLSYQGRCSGGVMVLVRKCFERFIERIETTCENIVILKLSKELLGTPKDVMHLSVYLPPSNSPFWKTTQNGYGHELIEVCIMNLYCKYQDFFLLLCGDLNSRTAEHNYTETIIPSDDNILYNTDSYMLKRSSCDKEINMFGNQLLDFCSVFDCTILNGLMGGDFGDNCTYVCESGSSLVDYYLISVELLHVFKDSHLRVKPRIESDHFPVELVFHPKTPHSVLSHVHENKTEKVFAKRKWDKDKEQQYKDAINAKDSQDKIKAAAKQIDTDLNTALDTFIDCLKQASECMVKHVRVNSKKKQPLWFDSDCQIEKRACIKLLKIFRKKRNEDNRKQYVEARTKYKRLLKQKKNEYKKNEVKMLSNNIKDSSIFWKNIKKIGGFQNPKKSSHIELSEWFEHFKNVFSECDAGNGINTRNSEKQTPSDDELNKVISSEEVAEAIKHLNSSKAAGPDDVLAEMIKTGGAEVTSFLVKFFNHVFDSGIYPTEWSKAIVVPLHKKGNPDVPDNYRGISLISVLCKCYTYILNRRLYSWLEHNSKIEENQAGFRRDYSTVDHIYTLYSVIQKHLNMKKRKMYVAFVDFHKAFDSVNHELLLKAIYHGGVNGKFFSTLKAMYSSLISCVRSENEYTDYFDCPVGVRQGCGLSPTLFSMYINQLANHINETGIHGVQMLPAFLELFILLFADDLVLLSTTPGGLQAQINSLQQCCNKLKLKVNKDKTKVMVFRKGGFLGKKEKWFYEGRELEVVNSYCYLGYTFTTMLSVKLGTNNLITKAKKAVYLICRAFQNCKYMTKEIFFKLFDMKIQSILLYSAEIWGLQRLDSIERIHLIACKTYLGVPRITPNKMIYGELERYPLYINSSIRCIKYWFRILSMDQSRLAKQAYLMQLTDDRCGKKCWASEIRELLYSMGFHFVWLNQGVGNVKAFLAVLKQRLIDTFLQEWRATIRDKERYILYKTFKHDFGYSSYLLNVDIYCFRVAIAQLRLGVLPINSNTHRFSDNPRVKMCPFCENCMEDERHFLTVCTLYTELRTRYLNIDSVFRPFQTLLACDQKDLARRLGKFIFYAIKKRRSSLELGVNFASQE
jgi:hypothetical protein